MEKGSNHEAQQVHFRCIYIHQEVKHVFSSINMILHNLYEDLESDKASSLTISCPPDRENYASPRDSTPVAARSSSEAKQVSIVEEVLCWQNPIEQGGTSSGIETPAPNTFCTTTSDMFVPKFSCSTLPKTGVSSFSTPEQFVSSVSPLPNSQFQSSSLNFARNFSSSAASMSDPFSRTTFMNASTSLQTKPLCSAQSSVTTIGNFPVMTPQYFLSWTGFSRIPQMRPPSRELFTDQNYPYSSNRPSSRPHDIFSSQPLDPNAGAYGSSVDPNVQASTSLEIFSKHLSHMIVRP